jgi:hypothetical protein
VRRTLGLARAGIARLRGAGSLAESGPWRLRVARTSGVCGVCGGRVRAGDVVYWRARGSSPRHGVCHEQEGGTVSS